MAMLPIWSLARNNSLATGAEWRLRDFARRTRLMRGHPEIVDAMAEQSRFGAVPSGGRPAARGGKQLPEQRAVLAGKPPGGSVQSPQLRQDDGL